MAQETKKESDRLIKYNEVVAKARLNDIQLLNMAFDVQAQFFDRSENQKLRYDVKQQATHYDVKIGLAAALITMTVAGHVGRRKVLTCKAAYNVVYDNVIDCDVEAVEAFLKRMARFACYPYFRSLFASVDWAAGLRLPPLPLHKEPPRPSRPPQERPKAVTKEARQK